MYNNNDKCYFIYIEREREREREERNRKREFRVSYSLSDKYHRLSGLSHTIVQVASYII